MDFVTKLRVAQTTFWGDEHITYLLNKAQSLYDVKDFRQARYVLSDASLYYLEAYFDQIDEKYELLCDLVKAVDKLEYAKHAAQSYAKIASCFPAPNCQVAV